RYPAFAGLHRAADAVAGADHQQYRSVYGHPFGALGCGVRLSEPVDGVLGIQAGHRQGRHGLCDFKLLAMLGAWGGWQVLPLTILLSSLVGAVLGIIILKSR